MGLIKLLSLNQNLGVGFITNYSAHAVLKTPGVGTFLFFAHHMVYSEKFCVFFKSKTLSSSWQKVKTSNAGKAFKSFLSVAICISNN